MARFSSPALPYLLSTETQPLVSERDGFHLGTDFRIARDLARERWHGRHNAGMPVVTTAVLDAKGRVMDVYDGDRWSSEYADSWD